jgi:hypothetical protein
VLMESVQSEMSAVQAWHVRALPPLTSVAASQADEIMALHSACGHPSASTFLVVIKSINLLNN